MTSQQPHRAARSGCHPSETSSAGGVFHECPRGGGRRWAQTTEVSLVAPVGPKKPVVAGQHLDPAAMTPSYTPWLPSLALLNLSTQVSVERIQHPGQGTEQSYSGTSSPERQLQELLSSPFIPAP